MPKSSSFLSTSFVFKGTTKIFKRSNTYFSTKFCGFKIEGILAIFYSVIKNSHTILFFDVLPLVQSNKDQKGVDKQNPNRVYKCVLGILLIDITPAVLHQTTILP